MLQEFVNNRSQPNHLISGIGQVESENEVIDLLSQIETESRVTDTSFLILNYWNDQKYVYPKIYEIARLQLKGHCRHCLLY